MDSKQVATILASLISQISLLVILLSHHFQFPISISDSDSDSDLQIVFTLLHHFISTSESIALSLLARPRKRTRTHFVESGTHLKTSPTHSKLGRFDRVDSVLIKNPDSFRLSFKMSASTFEWLSGLLEPLLECCDPVDIPLNDLSPELRLGLGLFRLTTGSSYSQLATQFRVTDRVAEFCTKQLCRVLCTNFRFWFGFLNQPGSFFHELTNLPNCFGAVGSTRFTLQTRTKLNPNPDSVAAQIVVDSSCRILNIVAGFHGVTNNDDILKSSTLYDDVENGTLLNGQHIRIGEIKVPQYLIAENGYTLRPWLITPYDDKNILSGSNEDNFNKCHRLITRVSIRKTVASLKNWGILSKPIDGEFRDAVAYISSCAILHNALLLRDDFSGLCDDLIDDYIVHDDFHVTTTSMELDSIDGCVIRTALATKAKDLSGSEI